MVHYVTIECSLTKAKVCQAKERERESECARESERRRVRVWGSGRKILCNS